MISADTAIDPAGRHAADRVYPRFLVLSLIG